MKGVNTLNQFDQREIMIKTYDLQKKDSKESFASYWHQIDESIKQSPKSILEIGVGNKFVSAYLKKLGNDVVTVDILRDLSPNITSSVLSLPFRNDSFDCCLCCEVLEHLPFERFEEALRELRRVIKGRLILSLPDVSPFLGIKIQVPHIKINPIQIIFPYYYARNHVYDGIHYWEIGKKFYSVKKIKQAIINSEFEIISTYRVSENSYHHFFIISKG